MVNANVKICVPEVFVQTVSGLYPNLKANIETTRDLNDVYEVCYFKHRYIYFDTYAYLDMNLS